MKQLIACLLFFCYSICGFADENDQFYQIEVVIFSHITPDGLASEYWPLSPPPIIPPTAIELTNYPLLPASHHVLKQEVHLLENNNYTILFDSAWTVSANDARKGLVFHLIGNDGESDNDPGHKLNGILAMRLLRYFSIHFNLTFLMPWDDIQNLNLKNITHYNNAPFLSFQIDDRLRMRSNELNYIDHPLYGVLIKIVPKSNANNT